jgi:hypothetical protein
VGANQVQSKRAMDFTTTHKDTTTSPTLDDNSSVSSSGTTNEDLDSHGKDLDSASKSQAQGQGEAKPIKTRQESGSDTFAYDFNQSVELCWQADTMINSNSPSRASQAQSAVPEVPAADRPKDFQSSMFGPGDSLFGNAISKPKDGSVVVPPPSALDPRYSKEFVPSPRDPSDGPYGHATAGPIGAQGGAYDLGSLQYALPVADTQQTVSRCHICDLDVYPRH